MTSQNTSSVNSGSVSEDIDIDNDGLLETLGRMLLEDENGNPVEIIPGTLESEFGALIINSNGSWSYSADNSQYAIQNLKSGETLQDVISVLAVDGSVHQISITIDGAGDAVTFKGNHSSSVMEDVDPDNDGLLERTGKVSLTDDGDSYFDFVSGTVEGAYGALTMNSNGSWSYSADNSQYAIQNLKLGESLQDVIFVAGVDGSVHQISITIDGSGDAVSFSGTTLGLVREDDDYDGDGLLETWGQVTASEDGITNFEFVAEALVGSYGTLSIDAEGFWRYEADNSQAVIQNLTENQGLTDTFTVTLDNGGEQIIQVDILSSGDAISISGTTRGEVTEDNDYDGDGLLETWGQLTATDDGITNFEFVAEEQAGNFGMLSIDAEGFWRYEADNSQADIQNLNGNQGLTETFTVTSVDGSEQIIHVDIMGVTDEWL